MSGDNHGQPHRVESIRKHSAQRLLAQPQPPSRSHEMDAHLYRLWIHLPRPQAGTPGKLTRVTQKHRPVLHTGAALTFTFYIEPGMGLFSGHRAAEEVSHFRVAPQRSASAVSLSVQLRNVKRAEEGGIMRKKLQHFG
jgi:hypothetical protein